MRLKKLTIQAFGPFKDKVVIDFENNQINHGLLLISGDTGSGKTTIFDAICYALYGETSSEDRPFNTLRSDWANPYTETFVELEFYYKNILYIVKRSPEYLRAKRVGEGFTKASATASIKINESLIIKPSEVTKKISELLGLTYHEFRQVAMLSQGEFTNFLLAPSEEKTTIFRKIFNTTIYDTLAFNLKNKMIIKKNTLENLKIRQEQEIKNISPLINLEGKSSKEIKELLKNEEENLKIKTQDLKKQRDNIIKDQTKLETELNSIKKINNDILKYQETSKELDNLIKNNQDISSNKKKYDYNIKVCMLINPILTKLNKDKELLEQKLNLEAVTTKKLNLKEKLYQSKEEDFKNLNNYPLELEKLTNTISELVSLNETYHNYLKRQEELEDFKKEYTLITNEYNKIMLKYNKIRNSYYLDVASSMADELEDNSPCPVCGSLNHPKKSSFKEGLYTKEDLDKAYQDLCTLEEKRKNKESKLEGLKSLINNFNIDSNLNITLEITKNQNLLSAKKDIKKSLDKTFQETTKLKEELTSIIKSLKDNITIYKEDISNLKTSIQKEEEELIKIYQKNNTDYQEYLIKKLDSEELNSLKNKINKYDTTKERLESILKMLEDVKDKKVEDCSLKEIALNELKNAYQNLDEEYTLSNNAYEKIKESRLVIEDNFTEYHKLEGEYQVLKILSDTASGTVQGKQKISFENYVQFLLLDSVLECANKRLEIMSDGRYLLKKKIDTRLNVKTGLDFYIFDAYTGKERSVNTLSGGEKFCASLALALGLSDTISNNKGGIKIDSLFIDEGFGSLDSEALDQALNTLSSLSENTKLVGIISHVPELISRIDKKIIVKKTKSGSTIKIVSE